MTQRHPTVLGASMHMANYYHLLLETPDANLSGAVYWLPTEDSSRAGKHLVLEPIVPFRNTVARSDPKCNILPVRSVAPGFSLNPTYGLGTDA
jgi:hypothetical protein